MELIIYYETSNKPYLCFRHATIEALYSGKKVETRCYLRYENAPYEIVVSSPKCVDCEKEQQAMKELEERRNGKD